MPFMRWSKDLKDLRKQFHEEIGSISSVKSFHGHLEEQSLVMLHRMRTRPDEFYDNVMQYVRIARHSDKGLMTCQSHSFSDVEDLSWIHYSGRQRSYHGID